MKPNSDDTSAYILKTVAPIFNMQGYIGTSLSHLTEATGLTKGAIYCNFKNKEDLAIQAFELNISMAIHPLFRLLKAEESSLKKLYIITGYHRAYYNLVKDIGGCPMLRVGVDAKFNNPLLFEKAQNLSERFLTGLIAILNEGIETKELKKDTNTKQTAALILSLIEGSSLLAFTHNDGSFLESTMNYIDENIIKNIET